MSRNDASTEYGASVAAVGICRAGGAIFASLLSVSKNASRISFVARIVTVVHLREYGLGILSDGHEKIYVDVDVQEIT